jgi:NTE family protein
VANRKLRGFVAAHASVQDLQDAQIPTHFVAADLLSGRDVLISSGDVATGALASCSIPGVLPPVEHSGRNLIDGAFALHTGIAQAVALGASIVYVLPAGAACALSRPPHSAVGIALHSLTLLLEQRLIHEISAMQSTTTIKLLPPLCPLAVSAADFSHAGELIARARQSSLGWMDSGDVDLPRRERFLTLHHHGRRPVAPSCRP